MMIFGIMLDFDCMGEEGVKMEVYAVFLISLSDTAEGQLWGRLTSLSDGESYDFGDLTEAVLKMEELLNRQAGPRSSPLRQFDRTGETRRGRNLLPAKRKGTKNQFCIRVYYRQHGSWQGEIGWQNGEQRIRFRSVLELLRLIDSVAGILQI